MPGFSGQRLRRSDGVCAIDNSNPIESNVESGYIMSPKSSRALASLLSIAAGALPCAAQESLAHRAFSVIERSCLACHGAAKTSGLDLRTRETALAGGSHGRAIDPSSPDESRLIRMVSHIATPTMPPGGRLSDEDIEILREWIAAGASYDGAQPSKSIPVTVRPITAEERSYWAFQRPKRVPPPAGAANPIDAFLLAAMKSKGLIPAARADRRTLIRRAYLDLTGLPPSPEEVEAFVKDPAPAA